MNIWDSSTSLCIGWGSQVTNKGYLLLVKICYMYRICKIRVTQLFLYFICVHWLCLHYYSHRLRVRFLLLIVIRLINFCSLLFPGLDNVCVTCSSFFRSYLSLEWPNEIAFVLLYRLRVDKERYLPVILCVIIMFHIDLC